MVTDSPKGPNLFLVGAPKCGTTSLYEYLRQHPQVFFPSAQDKNRYWLAKEPCFFCTDIAMSPAVSIKNRDEYLALYAGTDAYPWRGDASACMLRSRTAPGLIKSFCPDARILVTLRPPVDMMHSYHKEVLRNGWENILDFHEAVTASSDRDKGLRLPPNTPVPQSLNYLFVSDFAPQIEAYYRTFGRAAVKVVLLEDLSARPAETFRSILEFLEVDPDFAPLFRIHNEGPKAGRLESLLYRIHTIPGIRQASDALFPYPLRRRVLERVRRLGKRAREPIDPRDAALRERCRPDVERLAKLIDRDLSHWL